jgi:F0F1-type ATP synthase alpha subunit
VPVEKIVEFEPKMLEYLKARGAAVLAKIKEKGELTDEIAAELKKLIGDLKDTIEYVNK